MQQPGHRHLVGAEAAHLMEDFGGLWGGVCVWAVVVVVLGVLGCGG